MVDAAYNRYGGANILHFCSWMVDMEYRRYSGISNSSYCTCKGDSLPKAGLTITSIWTQTGQKPRETCISSKRNDQVYL
jgi:hypothetical protein